MERVRNEERLSREINTHISKLIKCLDNKEVFEGMDYLEKKIVDTIYFEPYVSLVEEVSNYLGNPLHQAVNDLSHLPSVFTDHGINHAYSVIRLCGYLTESLERKEDFIDDKLNEKEAFILLCAAWIHDIGMFVQLPEFTKKEVRKYHGKVSGNILEFIINVHKDRFVEILNNITSISLVAASHQTITTLKTLKNYNNDGRLDVLGAILRFADALDISEERANEAFFEFMRNFFGEPIETSFFEWNINYCVDYNGSGRNSITTDEIRFDLFIERKEKFIERIKDYKSVEIKEHNDQFHKEVTKQIDIDKEIIDIYTATFKKYIKLYLLDHIISFKNELEKEDYSSEIVKKIASHFLDFNVYFDDEIEGQIKEFDYHEREKYIGLYSKNRQTFWMTSANNDADLSNEFNTLREKFYRTVNSKECDIFIFFDDYERKKFRLYSGPNNYLNDEYATNYVERFLFDKKNNQPIPDIKTKARELITKELGDKVLISEKCGIIGFIAWSGIPEIIIQEIKDPRASYTSYDRCLMLENLLICPIFSKIEDKQRFLGILLINFWDKGDDWHDFKGKYLNGYTGDKITTTNEIIESLDLENEFESFTTSLDIHRI